MDKNKFLELVNKYLAGEASAEEEKALLHHYDQLQQQDPEGEHTPLEDEELRGRLYRSILMEIKQRERRRIIPAAGWAVAASLLLALLTAGLFYFLTPRQEQAAQVGMARVQSDITGGGKKATLTLADGSKITLDDAAPGVLASTPGLSVTKADDGQLIYKMSGPAAAGPGAARLAYNTIETPIGGQYQVHLPDGTRVWLNAGSALRFPTRFAGNARQVELKGEAYFEVAQNKKMPFQVLSHYQVVEVLGTHFNISAYGDEAAARTTLLEGSVRVTLPKQAASKLLVPGQQAVIGQAGTAIAVQPVDVEEAVAWKNGYFMFVDEDLESIMRQLARWYEVEVVYTGDVEKAKFGGTISRSKSLPQVLRILELTGNVQFKVEGRRVTVMP